VVRVLGSYTGILIEHPALARSALVTRPSGPNYLALVERLLSLLREGGVADPQSAWGVDLLLLFATSIALEHGTRGLTLDDGEDEEALAEALRQADATGYPTIAALGDDLLSGTPEARFEWHVRVLLAGIALTARPAERPGTQVRDCHDPRRLARRHRDPRSRECARPTRLTPRLRAILAVVLLADILDLMDSTITTIAAPSIARQLAGESHLSSGSGLATPWPWACCLSSGVASATALASAGCFSSA